MAIRIARASVSFICERMPVCTNILSCAIAQCAFRHKRSLVRRHRLVFNGKKIFTNSFLSCKIYFFIFICQIHQQQRQETL
ncbi:unnamed protein product [Rotaria magnacalcarata]